MPHNLRRDDTETESTTVTTLEPGEDALDPQGPVCVLLVGPITNDSAGDFMSEVFSAAMKHDGPIHIKLSSPGGDVDSGWAIYDCLRTVPNKIVMQGYGPVASIASLIFMAGDERYLSPEARFMVHEGTMGMTDRGYRAAEGFLKEAQFERSRYVEVMSCRAGMHHAEFERLMVGETYMSAKAACLNGFAHGIMPNKEGA